MSDLRPIVDDGRERICPACFHPGLVLVEVGEGPRGLFEVWECRGPAAASADHRLIGDKVPRTRFRVREADYTAAIRRRGRSVTGNPSDPRTSDGARQWRRLKKAVAAAEARRQEGPGA